MPPSTIAALRALREVSHTTLTLREGLFRGKVLVHLGTCGIAAGAGEIAEALRDELAQQGLTDILVATTGCAGLCSREPMITVELGTAAPIKYGDLTPEKARTIVADHLLAGHAVAELALGAGCERVG